MCVLMYEQPCNVKCCLGSLVAWSVSALHLMQSLHTWRGFESHAEPIVFMKGCLRITKYIYVYYKFTNTRRNKNFDFHIWIYDFLSWWKIMYLMVFSPKFLLETLENILETKISVKKLLNIFFPYWWKIIYYSFIYTHFFTLEFFTVSRHM